MQYVKLRTNTDCHEWCRIVSVANPASSPWMCDLGINVYTLLELVRVVSLNTEYQNESNIYFF